MGPATDIAEPLEVLETDCGYGLGVRSLAAWRAGDVVHRFSGVVGAELKQHTLQVNEHLHISGTRYIGYLSHGCDPNCRLDMSSFEMVALKDIAAGDLLTIDYAATEDRLFRQFACQCSALTCRRRITGRAEGADAEGRAYLARLAPETAA